MPRPVIIIDDGKPIGLGKLYRLAKLNWAHQHFLEWIANARDSESGQGLPVVRVALDRRGVSKTPDTLHSPTKIYRTAAVP